MLIYDHNKDLAKIGIADRKRKTISEGKLLRKFFINNDA